MAKKFASSQIFFHWVIFILIVVAYAAVELKGFAPKGSALRATIVSVHFTAGTSVLILMVIRIALKLFNKDPNILPEPPRWQMIAAKAMHGVLYLLFITLPVLGLLILYFGQVEWSFFSFTMPVDSVRNPDLRHKIKDVHEVLANAGYFIIGLHAAAAIFHHYIQRDNTLVRMLPFTKVKTSDQ